MISAPLQYHTISIRLIVLAPPEIDSRREIFSRPRQNCYGDLRHVRNLPEHLRELVVLLRGQSIQLLWLVESDKRDILP